MPLFNRINFYCRGKAAGDLESYLLGLLDHTKNEDAAEFCKRMEMTERLKKKTIENMERLGTAMAKLSMGIAVIKKSEVYRILEPLSREAKLFIMAKTKSEEIKSHFGLRHVTRFQ